MKDKEFCIMNDNPPYWRNFRFDGSERHEALFGGRNRKKSIEDGLVVFLTFENHRGTNGIHGKNGHTLDIMLKQEAEKKWLEYYDKTIDDFIKRYGKNYID